MPVRLRDVAERANVSVRTVSNVVNGYAHVAPETRARVEAVIADLGYRPNLSARQLRRGRTETLSLVVPEIDSPYFAELASRMARLAEDRGWTLHIDQTDGHAERERRMIAGPSGQAVDGVVCSPWAVDPDELAALRTTPLVLLGERRAVGDVDHVAIDNVAASREAVTHLLSLGRRRVAAVGAQPHLKNNTARLRVQGYHEALAAAGLPVSDELVVPVEALHRADGLSATTRLLHTQPAVDAIFFFTDQLALGGMRALADQGRSVPGDIAVAGFDDIEDGRYAVPSLTTVSPDKQELAQLALDALSSRLTDPGRPGEAFTARHRLVVRESTVGRR